MTLFQRKQILIVRSILKIEKQLALTTTYPNCRVSYEWFKSEALDEIESLSTTAKHQCLVPGVAC